MRVHGDDGVSEYVVVEPAEADASAGRVSSASPMGRALLGRVLGEMAKVDAPGGVRLVRVVGISRPGSEVGA